MFLKLRTSVGTGYGPDKSGQDSAGFRQDRHGFNLKLVTFLSLLRSDQFKSLIDDTRRDRRLLRGLSDQQGEQEFDPQGAIAIDGEDVEDQEGEQAPVAAVVVVETTTEEGE